MTKLEQVARALAVHQFGNPDSWEDQIPMVRVVVESLRKPNITVIEAEPEGEFDISNSAAHAKAYWEAMIDAILSERPECHS